ncbi:MAG: 23S rRNA (pseudouridine(1915)-N(3))-methyltransferase RlmH [Clostridia bacterium]|nr:23S rRNA (pseudouridine(1915)-N(3))-methyltransferase RlmH [Clostridia bacterium]
MIKVKIICLGKLKENYLKSAAEEYVKRLSRFCDLSIIELSPVSLSDNPSGAEIENALSKETVLIEKQIPNGYFITSLCVEGKELSSEDFAEKIKGLSNVGKNLCFIIGSSYGLSNEIKAKSDLRFSLSKMTFPHQLFRILLLEQIYRGFMINEGSTYHK